MISLKKIINCLKENKEVYAWTITDVCSKSIEEFYVLQNLETTRKVNVHEINVGIYKEIKEEGNTYLGTSNFIINRDINKKELVEQINKTLYAASFVKNEYYEIPEGEKKIRKKGTKLEKDPFELLQDIAVEFKNANYDNGEEIVKFNSLELFYNEKESHIINSNGVDYKKVTSNIMVEAIPSYASKEFKTELYRDYNYTDFGESLLAKVKEDCKNAVSDILDRAKAQKNDSKKKINVILKDREVGQFFWELISTYTYYDEYSHSNTNNVGDMIQDNPKTLINLKLDLINKNDFFDFDGTLFKPVELIKDGKLINTYGNGRFAYYLKKEPTGMLKKIILKKGNKSIDDLKKKPYVEIIDLSGLQLDLYAGYIGGEVRLAKYFDGEKTYPISGFSFTGSLKECINSFVLSKETYNSSTLYSAYDGPKYIVLKDLEIN